MREKILIVDDDPDITRIIQLLAEGEGYQTVTASDGADALEKLDGSVELIILDVMMPGMDGYETCRRIRQLSYAPILFLSAMSGDFEKITALTAGGDDYLCKPFSAAELLTRIKSLLRRYKVYRGPQPEPPEERDSLVLGADNEITVNGRLVKLSYTEYEILHLFLSNRGRVLSIPEIYEAIWAEPYNYAANNIVMVHIYKIRRKLEQDCKHPTILKTAWGKGYYID